MSPYIPIQGINKCKILFKTKFDNKKLKEEVKKSELDALYEIGYVSKATKYFTNIISNLILETQQISICTINIFKKRIRYS